MNPSSLYAQARAHVARIPHSDLRADAEDAVHDCIVDLLERGIEPEDWPTFVSRTLPRFVLWESMRAGRAVHRRHYGGVFLSKGASGRERVHRGELSDYTERGPTPPLACLRSAVSVFADALHAWGARSSWAPWAWILTTIYDWRASECARVLGCSAPNVRHQLRKFEALLCG